MRGTSLCIFDYHQMASIMFYRIGIFVFVLSLATACVSPKLVEELKTEQQATNTQNKSLKKENLSFSTQNTELSARVERLSTSVEQLISDSLQRSTALTHLQNSHHELNDAYDLLLTENNQTMAKKAKETKKLLGELQLAQEDLQTKEDALTDLEENLTKKQKQLIQTQEELQARERKVVELEDVISRKDSIVDALKNRISAALLGFEGDGLTIAQKNGKVYISLDEQLLFASGSWKVDERGKEALGKLSMALENQLAINVMIEGHTDSIPFGGRGQIKDNWDLSVVRSTAIVRILTESSTISAARITAAGRGEFSPLTSNTTREGRSANRRIEIILSPKLDDLYEMLNN